MYMRNLQTAMEKNAYYEKIDLNGLKKNFVPKQTSLLILLSCELTDAFAYIIFITHVNKSENILCILFATEFSPSTLCEV